MGGCFSVFMFSFCHVFNAVSVGKRGIALKCLSFVLYCLQ